jgi:hypothetical protein
VKHPVNPWYVTGFAEGCGSFTYSRSSGVFGLYFALKVGVTDLPILQGIQAFFRGAGRIYIIRGRSEKLVKRAQAAYFRVTRAAELPRVVAHFDRYRLAGSKVEQYAIWREMVSLKQRFRRPDVERLTLMAARLSALTQQPRLGPSP